MKRNLKKWMVTLPLLFLPFSSLVNAEEKGFTDTKDASVLWMKQILLIEGYQDGSFRPYRALTRSELSSILANLYVPRLKIEVLPLPSTFEDVRVNHWGQKSIDYLAMAGIVEGYPQGKFYPEKTVTWAECLSILMRMVDHVQQKENWPSAYVQQANIFGLSLPSNIHRPITRGELASLLYQWKEKDPLMKGQIQLYTTLKLLEQVGIQEKREDFLKLLVYGDFHLNSQKQVEGYIQDAVKVRDDKTGFQRLLLDPVQQQLTWIGENEEKEEESW